MSAFLNGAIFFGFLVAGLFFVRFWRETGDRFFLLFGIAFWLQAGVRLGLSAFGGDERLYLYLLRLAAYLLILVAIAQKNVGRAEPLPDR